MGRHYVNHPDHRAAGRSAVDAVYPASKKPLMFPELLAEELGPHVVRELWLAAPEDADTFVDISDVLDEKVKAVLTHRTQFPDDQVADFVRTWGRFAARHLPCEAAEAFRSFDLRAKTVHHRFQA
jgi:LmbE family N-acetylglucosaminyl deacetylase